MFVSQCCEMDHLLEAGYVPHLVSFTQIPGEFCMLVNWKIWDCVCFDEKFDKPRELVGACFKP